MTNKSGNYTEEEKQIVTTLYAELGNDGLQEIAEKVHKTINSVRAKLVREGIYIVPDKASKRKTGASKKNILRELEDLGLVPDGLEGATKSGLQNIKNLILKLKK